MNKIANLSRYEIQPDGEVWDTLYKRLLKQSMGSWGYFVVTIARDDGPRSTFAIHRLVAMAYIGSIPTGMVVNHIDGNKENNHFSNLEIVTQSRNASHAWEIGLNHGQTGYRKKDRVEPDQHFAAADEVDIVKFYSSGLPLQALAERYNITEAHVREICERVYL